MNLRQYILFLSLLGLCSLVFGGHPSLFAQVPSPDSGQSASLPLVVAKQTKQRSPSPSSLPIKNVRYHDHKTYTRIVLDLPARTAIKETKNTKTSQVTIRLDKSHLSARALKKIRSSKFPRAITIDEKKDQTVSVTLDLTALEKYELLTLGRPNRLVLDLFYSSKPKVLASRSPQKRTEKPSLAIPSKKKEPLSSAPAVKENTTIPTPVKPPDAPQADVGQMDTSTSTPPPFVAKHPKDLVVIIDPGHGGKDPGAIGRKGTKEKHVTLQIGNYLKELIQQRLGAKVLLTRNKDVFLDLEQRVEFANKNKADLFISIHVNSHPQKSIHGLEVYHFGKASDPRALEVAARENGMTLEDNAPAWQFIIADKLNDQKIEESQTLAWTTNKTLVKTLKASHKIKDHGVKTAPFYVLRFTTMPSILAEVAFVSNSEDEKRLRSKSYQKQLAEGMFKGIQSYLETVFPALS